MGWFDWLFGKAKKKPPRLRDERPRDEAPAATGWQVGERVLASWVDTWFYPGRVRQVQAGACEIAFDDGDSAWVEQANVCRPDIGVGSAVSCRFHAGPMYLPGTVREHNGEKIHVEYENGEKEWTTISMVRVKREFAGAGGQPAAPRQGPAMPTQGMPMPGMLMPGMPMPGMQGPMMGGPMVGTMTAAGPMMGPPPGAFIPDVGEPVSDSNWRSGDRVLGRWYDFYWYPATILAIGTKGYHILFDDGDQRVVQDLGLMAISVEEGEELFIRPKNQPQRIYTPARVLRAKGEIIDVELDDGTEETNQKLSRARLWRCPVGFGALPFDEGDRVWAHDIDGCVYPAEVLSIDNDRIVVSFLDGPERMLTPELLRPFELRPGAAVQCRWKGGQTYFPGKVSEMEGDRVHIAYDDGDKEWTTVRLVRQLPK